MSAYSSGAIVAGLGATPLFDRNGNVTAATLTVTGATAVAAISGTVSTMIHRMIVGQASATFTFGANITSTQGLAFDTANTVYTFGNTAPIATVSLYTLGNGTANATTNITATNFTALYVPQPAATGFTITKTWGIMTTGAVYVNNSTASSSAATGALVVDGGVGIGGALNVTGTISGGTVSPAVITAANGSATAPAFAFANSTGTGMYYVPTSLAFAVAGTNYATLTNTGDWTLASGRLLVTATGSVSAPALCIGSSTATGLYSTAADQIAVSVAGTQRILFAGSLITLGGNLRALAGSAASVSVQVGEASTGIFRAAAGQFGIGAAGTQIVLATATYLAVSIAGSASAPSLVWGANTTSGFYSAVANQISCAISGSQIVNITSSGLTTTTASLSTIILGVTTITAPGGVARSYTVPDAGGATSFLMRDYVGGQTVTGGLTLTDLTTFGAGGAAATGSGNIDFSGASGTFKSTTGAVTLGTGAITLTGATKPTAGFTWGPQSVTSATSLVAATSSPYIVASGTFTITLPGIQTTATNGLQYLITNIGTGTITVAVANSSSESFDGLLTSIDMAQYDRVHLVANQFVWQTY